MKFEVTPAVQTVLKKIEERQGKIWVVGGAVRDTLLNRPVKDIDLATDLLPSEVETIVEEFKYPRVASIRDFEHGIIRFCNPDTGEIVDIATLRKDDSCDGRFAKVSFTKDIREDLARRDLTINAMAAEITHDGSLKEKSFIHIIQGDIACFQDMDDKIIRFVGIPEQRILEDNLRMIRACRFTALGDEWKMGGTDEQAIIKHAHLIKTVPKERIHDEIVKGLSYPKPSNFFRAMQKCGLLKHIMPDVELGVGCDGGQHHAETVFDHLMYTLDAACKLDSNPIFRLAALTHDIAKPHTKEVKADGTVTFYKHEVVGASIVYKWMGDYRFPKKECEYVSKLVRHHMFRMEEDSTDKTIRKFLQEIGKDLWPELFKLRIADREGNMAKVGKSKVPKALASLSERIQKMLDAGTPLFKEDLAINGDDLKELGIKPGPIYGEITSQMLGIVITNPERNTREWLTAYVLKNYVKNAEEKEASSKSGADTK